MLDAPADIILDADGGDVAFRDGGTGHLQISNVSNDAKILSLQTDKDLIFSGIDGGSEIEAMRIDMSAGGFVGIGTTSPTAILHISTPDDTEFLKATIEGNESWAFKGFSGSGVTDNVSFGISGGTQCMTWQEDGNVSIGNTNPADDTPAIGFQFDVTSSNTSFLNIGHTSSAGTSDGFVRFVRSNTIIGQIRTDGVTNVQYATSSDYRLKENIITEWDATTRLKQLKPSRFNFKEEKDRTRDGFIAHEVSSVVPEAVGGEKDAVDKHGNIDPQTIDHSKLVPLLTKSLQEALARIDTLEAEVKTLKG